MGWFDFFDKKPETHTETPQKVSCHFVEPFNLTNHAHIKRIEDQIKSFEKALQALQAREWQLQVSLTVTAVCWLGSFAFPLTLAGYGISLYVGHHLTRMSDEYETYSKAFADLKEVYQWSMAKETGSHKEKLQNKTIEDLILTIGPWLKYENLKTWKESDCEATDIFGRKWKMLPAHFEEKLNQISSANSTNTLKFSLYGEGDLFYRANSVKNKAVNGLSQVLENILPVEPSKR